MAEKVFCPKCESHGAWYFVDRVDVTLRCLCGYNKVVASKLDADTLVEHFDQQDEVTLPRAGSKLYQCLVALVALGKATTGEIAFMVNLNKPKAQQQSSSDIASHLTVLRYKALVEVKVERKGVAGGSTWVPKENVVRAFKGVR